jgi:hypothetical protein
MALPMIIRMNERHRANVCRLNCSSNMAMKKVATASTLINMQIPRNRELVTLASKRNEGELTDTGTVIDRNSALAAATKEYWLSFAGLIVC